MKEPVVVTGIGIVSPLGCSREKTWSRVRGGESCLKDTPVLDLKEFATLARTAPFAGPGPVHRALPIALSAAAEALGDAGISLESAAGAPIGCSVSCSKPLLDLLVRRADPPESVLGYLLQKLKIGGPAVNVVAACASGIHSIATACRWLGEGFCRAALAGSVESSLHPLYLSGFQNLGVLSSRPKPFDKGRDGFLIGEGGAVLVLEERRRAEERGARIYAEVAGTALGADWNHPTRMDSRGTAIASVLKRLLERSPDQTDPVDYINLHGTGTPLNDRAESAAVREVFGDRPFACSSTKGATGHLLGAAGSLEAALTCLALRDQFVPPTAHCEDPDPECGLDVTPIRGRALPLRAAISLSIGFGGPVAAILFKKP